MQSPIKDGKVTVEGLKGLNERKMFNNEDPGTFDILRGAVPTTAGTLTRPGGIQILQALQGEQVLQIFQTNDSNSNVIVQTNLAIRIISENDLFGYTFTPTLTPASPGDDDIMPRAILQHSAASGTNGGGSTNTLTQMPMTEIVSQVNADGTAASFCALVSNQFTLQAGVYVLDGWHVFQSANPHASYGVLWNVTANVAAWATATNQNTNQILHETTGLNVAAFFRGVLAPTVPTTYEWRGICSTATANTGLGVPAGQAGAREVYGQLEILKTA